MATQIVITANTDQAKRETTALAGALDNVGTQATQAASETAAAGEKIEDALEEVQAEAHKTERAIDGIGGAGILSGITAASTSVLAFGGSLKMAFEASKKALEGITILAEQGNPAAVELKGSIDQLLLSLQGLAEDPAMQRIGESLAGITRSFAQDVSDLPEIFRVNMSAIEVQWIQLQESLGIAEEGAMMKFAGRLAAQRIDLDQQKASIANEKARLVEAEKAKQVAEEEARAAKAAAEEEDRFQQQLADDAERIEREEFDKKNAHIAELVRAEEAAIARVREAEIQANQDRAREREAEVERKRRELEGTGLSEAINQQASDPQALARQLAKQAAEAKMVEIQQGGGDVDSAQNKRAIEEARRQAHRAAIQQSRGGRETFSQEQIAEAQQANAAATIQSMGQSGRFSETMLQALSEAATAQRNQATDVAQLTDHVEELRRMIRQTSSDSGRKRAQRGSNRQ